MRSWPQGGTQYLHEVLLLDFGVDCVPRELAAVNSCISEDSRRVFMKVQIRLAFPVEDAWLLLSQYTQPPNLREKQTQTFETDGPGMLHLCFSDAAIYAGCALCGLTFELTPTAEAGGVRLV